MKNLSLLVCLLVSINIFSQENNTLELGNYIFTSPFQTDSITDFNGKKILVDRRIHEVGKKFKIINKKKDYVIIQYWEWNEKSGDQTEKAKKFTLNNSFYKDGRLKYFVIKNETFFKIAARYFNRNLPVTAGIYSIPFKLRFNNFDFEQDLNIGISIGFPFRINRKFEKKWVLEPNFGIGITKINLNKKNTNGVIDSIRTASAFTISSGLIIRFSEKINFGTFIGVDLLSKADTNTNWLYNKKIWIGLGINISLNITKEKDEKEGKNKIN